MPASQPTSSVSVIDFQLDDRTVAVATTRGSSPRQIAHRRSTTEGAGDQRKIAEKIRMQSKYQPTAAISEIIGNTEE